MITMRKMRSRKPFLNAEEVKRREETRSKSRAVSARARASASAGGGVPCADEPFDASRYGTVDTLLDSYAAFHAHSIARGREGRPRRSLVFVPNQYGLGNRLRAVASAMSVAARGWNRSEMGTSTGKSLAKCHA